MAGGGTEVGQLRPSYEKPILHQYRRQGYSLRLHLPSNSEGHGIIRFLTLLAGKAVRPPLSL